MLEVLRLLRKVPAPVRRIVVEVVRRIVQSKDPAKAARLAAQRVAELEALDKLLARELNK